MKKMNSLFRNLKQLPFTRIFPKNKFQSRAISSAVSRRKMTDELSECIQKIDLKDSKSDDESSSSSSSSSSGELANKFEIEDVEALLREGKVKNIVMVVGAGISTSAGIPDFRTPGTGLYR